MKSFPFILLLLTQFISACSDQQSAEQHIQNGQKYFQNKEWKSSIIEFKNAVKQEPDNSLVRALLGKAYLETYSTNAAIKELEKARDLGIDTNLILVSLGKSYAQANRNQQLIDEIVINQNQNSEIQTRIYALRAIAFIKLGDSGKALSALNKAKQLDEYSVDVRLAWALYEKLQNNIEQQRKWLKPLLAKEEGIADAWSMMGEIEQNAENYEAAEIAYTQSITLRQYGHMDSVRRAIVRIALNDYEGAKADISALKKLGAKWPVVTHTEGVIAFQNKNFDKALTLFQKVLSKSPDYLPSQFMLSLIYYDRQNYQNAASLLEQYTVENSENDRALFIYANSLIKLDQVNKALNVLEKLHKRNEADYRVSALMANAYLLQKRNDDAISVLRKSVLLNPKLAELRMRLGTALLVNESTFQQGQLELNQAIKLDPDLYQAKIALFRSYLAEKNYNKATKLALKIREKNPDKPDSGNLIALVYLAQNKNVEAINELMKTLKRFPADFLTSQNLGRIYIQQKKLDQAKELYQNVLQLKPTHLQTLNQLALIASRQGDYEKMMSHLLMAQQNNTDNLSARLMLSLQYLRQNKPSQAVTLLNDANEDQKLQPGYILLMAQSKIELNESQHAIRSLKALTKRYPDTSAAYLLLAKAYALEERPKEMRDSLEKVIAIVPDHLMGNITLARLDLQENKIDDFEKRVKILDQNYPENKDVKFLKAKVASGTKDYAAAISTLSSIMNETPYSEVVIDLAINQWQSGDKESAISGLELWLQENERDTRALMLIAQYYLDENRQNDAKDIYQKLDTLIPNNPTVLNNLAWVLKDIYPEQGIKYAEKALELKPENPYITDTLAMLHLTLGNNKEAVTLSKKAFDLAPQRGDIRLNYAKALIANNENTKAREILIDLYEKTRSIEAKNQIKKELDKI